MPQRTVTPDDLEKLRQLHTQGLTLTAIAKQLGFAKKTISVHAARIGLRFDRAQTRNATRARSVDLTVRRQELAERMIEEAHWFLDQLHQPFKAYNFGGKDNIYREVQLDHPPVDAQRQIMTSAAIAFDKASKIVDKDTMVGDTNAVDEWLDFAMGNKTP